VGPTSQIGSHVARGCWSAEHDEGMVVVRPRRIAVLGIRVMRRHDRGRCEARLHRGEGGIDAEINARPDGGDERDEQNDAHSGLPAEPDPKPERDQKRDSDQERSHRSPSL
jgi:hypothetical protein